MAGLGRLGHRAAALADRLEDLFQAGDARGQDRAPRDDRAHIYQDGVRRECAEVKLRKRVVRLEIKTSRLRASADLTASGSRTDPSVASIPIWARRYFAMPSPSNACS